MRLMVQARGLQDLRARIALLEREAKLRAQVTIASPRSAEIANYHASPESRTIIPYRNPFFLTRADFDWMRRRLRDAIRAVLAGSASSIKGAMQEIAERARDRFRINIAPPARLDSAHRGRSDQEGSGISDGLPMTPLTAKYAKRKKKAFGPKPILVASGQLWRDIQARVKDA